MLFLKIPSRPALNSTHTEPGIWGSLDRYDGLIPEVPYRTQVRVGDVGERAVLAGQAAERRLGELHRARDAGFPRGQRADLAPQPPRAGLVRFHAHARSGTAAHT